MEAQIRDRRLKAPAFPITFFVARDTLRAQGKVIYMWMDKQRPCRQIAGSIPLPLRPAGTRPSLFGGD